MVHFKIISVHLTSIPPAGPKQLTQYSMNKTFTGTVAHCKVSGILPKSGLMTTPIFFAIGGIRAKPNGLRNG